MRTIHRYEAQDIDMADPIHGFVMAQILLALLTIKAPKHEAESIDILKNSVAQFLNAAADAGIAITKSEIPEAFRASEAGT